MAYNNGREDRKWRIWKEAEEKVLREHGVDEATIEQIRIDDRADFNSNRRFYHWTSDFGEYLEGMADREQSAEVKTVEDLLDEIEDENLYQALLTVDRRTLQIVLLKMKGYSTKEIAPIVGSKNQADDLIEYIKGNMKDNPDGIWDTNIFGKTIEQIVSDGIYEKTHNMTAESMGKIGDTIEKVMNENSGLVCLIV